MFGRFCSYIYDAARKQCLTETWVLLFSVCCLTSSAYQEWLRGQALRRHSNLVQLPRC